MIRFYIFTTPWTNFCFFNAFFTNNKMMAIITHSISWFYMAIYTIIGI